jgi:hypothetical protein
MPLACTVKLLPEIQLQDSNMSLSLSAVFGASVKLVIPVGKSVRVTVPLIVAEVLNTSVVSTVIAKIGFSGKTFKTTLVLKLFVPLIVMLPL